LDRLNRPTHGGNLVWAASIASCPVNQILDFSASINPLGPGPGVISALQQNLLEIDKYPIPGYLELRTALAQRYQISPDWILPGNGAAELLTWAGRELANYQTFLPVPAFNDYGRALKAFSAKVTTLPLLDQKGNLVDLPQHLSTLSIPNNAALLLNNPHNPSGALWKQQTLLPLLDRFALVVIDESFMDFVSPSQSLVPWVAEYKNLVVISSLTKFYSLPGIRLGYCVAHPDRLARWQSWRDPWVVNRLAEVAGIAALADQEFIDQTWNWYQSCQSTMFDGLQQVPNLMVYPSAANFFLLRTVKPFTTVQTELLQQFKIFARDCLSFPELGTYYGRVAVKSEADNYQLITALNQICNSTNPGDLTDFG
jgi:L-threonine-O-3-phosphate decarboxylase